MRACAVKGSFLSNVVTDQKVVILNEVKDRFSILRQANTLHDVWRELETQDTAEL